MAFCSRWPRVQALGVLALNRDLIGARGLAAADADGGRQSQKCPEAGEARDLGPQLIHDLLRGEGALAAGLQDDVHAAAVAAGSAEAAADVGHERHNVGVFADYVRELPLVVHHLVEGSSLRRDHVQIDLIVVLVGDEALGDDPIQVDGAHQHHHEDHPMM